MERPVDEQQNKVLNSETNHPSSDRRMNRAEFLKKVAATGGLLAAPVIMDVFLIQPAARASGVRGSTGAMIPR